MTVESTENSYLIRIHFPGVPFRRINDSALSRIKKNPLCARFDGLRFSGIEGQAY